MKVVAGFGFSTPLDGEENLPLARARHDEGETIGTVAEIGRVGVDRTRGSEKTRRQAITAL